MKIISVSNQKGGVAKTTTVINLGYFLSKKSKILLIDIDPQANLSRVFGYDENHPNNNSIYECLINEKKICECISTTEFKNIDIIPSNINLADAEIELISKFNRESILSESFKHSKLDYDYVLIDCNPSLGLLTINALATSDSVIIPLEPCEFSFAGIGNLMKIINLIKKINSKLDILGVLLTRVNTRTKISKEFGDQLNKIFGDRVFNTKIHQNIKISEAHENKKPVGVYAPQSKGALEYSNLAKEIHK